jgi:hypothetical protein
MKIGFSRIKLVCVIFFSLITNTTRYLTELWTVEHCVWIWEMWFRLCAQQWLWKRDVAFFFQSLCSVTFSMAEEKASEKGNIISLLSDVIMT